jgi:hypothetical protein
MASREQEWLIGDTCLKEDGAQPGAPYLLTWQHWQGGTWERRGLRVTEAEKDKLVELFRIHWDGYSQAESDELAAFIGRGEPIAEEGK